MKIDNIIDNKMSHRTLKESPKAVEPDIHDASTDATVMFPTSDRFKHMLSLIARDNKELYNRIVGLE